MHGKLTSYKLIGKGLPEKYSNLTKYKVFATGLSVTYGNLTSFNPLMLTAAKTGLTILEIFF